jgi:hypothetical protein
MCSVYDWCYGQSAKIKFAPATSQDAASVVGVTSTPKAPCPAPWATACFNQECQLRASVDSGAQAVFVRGTDGKARIDGQEPAFAGPAKGTTGDFPGVTFNFNGNVYKVQFKTGFVFRLSASGGGTNSYVDSGGTLIPSLLAEICSANGLSCGSAEKATCKELGLSPQGKAWADARGGLWTNAKGSGCVQK